MKDSRYFKHDANARNDPKMKAVFRKYGIAGIGIFWDIIEMFREHDGFKLEDSEITWMALSTDTGKKVEYLKIFVSYCEQIKLFIREDNFFYSPSFLKKMSDLEMIRQKKINAGKSKKTDLEEAWND